MLNFSRHAAERLAERFPETKIPGVSAFECLRRAMEGAKEERGFLNNTAHLVNLVETKGDFNYDYYVKDDMVFVVHGGLVKTVMNRNDNSMVRLMGPKRTARFRKKG